MAENRVFGSANYKTKQIYAFPAVKINPLPANKSSNKHLNQKHYSTCSGQHNVSIYFLWALILLKLGDKGTR